MAENSYDAIIIGAGIGGLVCGCYLAKAGMKVLICEQHYKPGGYCTSFKRKGFIFDAAAHCLGGYRKDGITRKVFENLQIDTKLRIYKSDPSDTIITPDYKVSFWSDLEKTIGNFQSAFPEEANNIRRFFSFLLDPDPAWFAKMRSLTLKDLLDKYFSHERLKAILCAPLLGLGGLPPSMMSAFVGAKLFSEFLLDGGYHPEGGMQALPDTLAARFEELGGELRLSCLVRKITVKDKTVTGIFLEEGAFVPSRIVISNCDARQTYLKLLGAKNIEKDFSVAIKIMTPSISNFVAYIGLDQYFDSLPQPGTTVCFFPHYDLNRSYEAAQRGDIERYGGYMFYVSKEMPTILAIIPAPFKSKTYWSIHKQGFLESLISRLEEFSVPQLSKHVRYKEGASPQTLYRYTLNYRGASFGWAGTPSQLAVRGFKKASSVGGLYLTGHWTTQGLGISGVVYVGHDTARTILRKNFGNI